MNPFTLKARDRAKEHHAMQKLTCGLALLFVAGGFVWSGQVGRDFGNRKFLWRFDSENAYGATANAVETIAVAATSALAGAACVGTLAVGVLLWGIAILHGMARTVEQVAARYAEEDDPQPPVG